MFNLLGKPSLLSLRGPEQMKYQLVDVYLPQNKRSFWKQQCFLHFCTLMKRCHL